MCGKVRSAGVGIAATLGGWGGPAVPEVAWGCDPTCGECGEPLVDDNLNTENGSTVQISKCPNEHGKIKSPLCCGQDMSCSVR